MIRLVVLVVAAGALLGGIVHAGAAASSVDRFRTPGDIAYCSLESSPEPVRVTCFSPPTGDWVRVALDVRSQDQPTVAQGRRSAYLGFHDQAWPLLSAGRPWSRPGDTDLVNCKPAATSVTCRWNGGLVVKIRRTGIRVFLGKFPPPPVVVPYFRTEFGVRCGLENGGVAGTDGRVLLCWNPVNGLETSIRADDKRAADYTRVESNIGFTPSGFRLLKSGTSRNLRWCESTSLACDPGKGAVIFRCAATATTVTCRNPVSHGFTIRRDGSFLVF